MFLVYLGITEVLIQFITREVIFKKIAEFLDSLGFNIFEELQACRKCVGFWVSLAVSLVFRSNFFETIIAQDNIINIVSCYFINAVITTYLLYYLQIGITTIHQTIIVGRN